ncbi:MAG: AmmeMemoRadiSam system protein B [Pirellulales bacterium]|nr:AmmeMemoRadiSam system protein B [Pirellulales bacterium]
MRTLFFSVILVCVALPVHAQQTRPIKAKNSYCWSGPQMERFMSFLQAHAPKKPDDLPPLIAGIAPHADYRHAGRVYYPLFQKISSPEVVIFGVTHRAIREKLGQPQDKLILDAYVDWPGPYGNVEVSPLREYLKKHLDPQYYTVNNDAHRMDHSIEGLLPFLQYGRRDVRITPVMVTAMSFDTMDTVSAKLAKVLTGYMKEKHLEPGKDVFFLISADANHYGKEFNNTFFGEGAEAHGKGAGHDRHLVDTYLQGPISIKKLKDLSSQLWGEDFKSYGDVVWCGQYTIPFGLLTVHHLMETWAPEKQLTGKRFLYGDSYSDGVLPADETGLGTASPPSLERWVGFFSAGYYLRNGAPGGQ